MAIVDRVTLELQLEDELRASGLSDDDKALCRALVDAIRCVQRPEWFGRLPRSAKNLVMRWAKGRDKAAKCDPDRITRHVEFLEREYPKLKRKREYADKRNTPTVYQVAAKHLGIETNTVVNKTKKKTRKLPRTIRPK